MLRRILHKFGLAFTLEYKSWPNQDSWYPLDPCGEKESFENEDINEHNENEEATEMDENKEALNTEKSSWNKGRL